MKKRIVVIGSGMMGSGIAARAASAGNEVVMQDMTEQKAEQGKARAVACLQELRANDLLSEDVQACASHIFCAADLESAVKGADLVVEAISEELHAKQRLFRQLDELLPPNVPIVSNTSGLRITEIAAEVKNHPERTMTAHFWMPAHLVPLVEIVLWEKTGRKMAEQVKQELLLWGKAPVLVMKDLPGQLANRILQAVIREASNIVEIGLASPEDVDTAVKMGMGIRFPVWGPLEHVDAVGMELCASVQNKVLPAISDKKSAANIFDEKLHAGECGYKSGKGFYDWSKKDMQFLEKYRNNFIMNSLKFMREYESSV